MSHHRLGILALTHCRTLTDLCKCTLVHLRGKGHKSSQELTFSVYTIHGGKDLEEMTLDHLAGHKNSKPVRIGNGAADHLQLVNHTSLTQVGYSLTV